MRNKLRYLAPNKLIDKLWLNYVSTDNESSWHFSWKGSWRRFRGNGDWNAEVSDQYAILLKILNDYKIKRKQRSSVLLKVALLWLSSEYGGRGVGGGQSTEKVLRCVMRRREGPVFCLWYRPNFSLYKKRLWKYCESKVSFWTMVFAKKKNG